MIRSALAFSWGALFALGLGIGGLSRADVIQGAVDFTGDWNPAVFLAVVGVAVVYQLGYRLALRRGRPLLADKFCLPEQTKVDARLLWGSAIFGAGWGLAGMCPGATLVSLPGGDARAVLFMATVLVVIRTFAAVKEAGTQPRGTGEPGAAFAGRAPK